MTFIPMMHLLIILDNLDLFLWEDRVEKGGLSLSLMLHFLGCQFLISAQSQHPLWVGLKLSVPFWGSGRAGPPRSPPPPTQLLLSSI